MTHDEIKERAREWREKIQSDSSKGIGPHPHTFYFWTDERTAAFAGSLGASGPRCPKCGNDDLTVNPPTDDYRDIEIWCSRCKWKRDVEVGARGFAKLADFAQFFRSSGGATPPAASPQPTNAERRKILDDLAKSEAAEGLYDREGEESLGASGPPTQPDNWVAWCRYIRNDAGETYAIRLCNSDSPGAFKVYRHPAPAGATPPAASPLRIDHLAGCGLRYKMPGAECPQCSPAAQVRTAEIVSNEAASIDTEQLKLFSCEHLEFAYRQELCAHPDGATNNYLLLRDEILRRLRSIPSPAASPLNNLHSVPPKSSTYGDLPEELLNMIQPHEWDNMNFSQQRDWAIAKLAAASGGQPQPELTHCICGHHRADHQGIGPSRGKPLLSACGVCKCNQWRPSKARSQSFAEGSGELEFLRQQSADLAREIDLLKEKLRLAEATEQARKWGAKALAERIATQIAARWYEISASADITLADVIEQELTRPLPPADAKEMTIESDIQRKTTVTATPASGEQVPLADHK